jgi:hypothetical protein
VLVEEDEEDGDGEEEVDAMVFLRLRFAPSCFSSVAAGAATELADNVSGL